MARINVEQKALTDPRFYRLGTELGAGSKFAQAVGLFTMVRIWNECIERGRYALEGWVLQAVVGETAGPEILVSCDLAVEQKKGVFRIRGTKGRVEYLEEKRRNGRKFGHLGAEHGKKGGRPPKTRSGGFENQSNGIPNNPPPAPAPAPAPALKTQEGAGGENINSNIHPDDIVMSGESREAAWGQFGFAYPNRSWEDPAARLEWDKLNLTQRTFSEIMAGVSRWKRSSRWQQRQFQKDAKNFLAQAIWKSKTPEDEKTTSQNLGETPEQVAARNRASMERLKTLGRDDP